MKPPKVLWVLVDKYGVILEEGKLRKASLEYGPEVPMFTWWKNRADARWQIKQIKNNMIPEAYSTWKFKVIRYNLNNE